MASSPGLKPAALAAVTYLRTDESRRSGREAPGTRSPETGVVVRNSHCLDREALGRMAFWREFRLAAKEKGIIKILTHKKNVDDLPIDLKLLLKRVANNDPEIGAILGLPEGNRRVRPNMPAETIGLMMIGIMTLMIAFFIRNQYKCSVSTNPDGTVAIEAEPDSA